MMHFALNYMDNFAEFGFYALVNGIISDEESQ